MVKTVETDVVVIGTGISTAMFVEHLAETTDAAITVVEASNKIFNYEEPAAYRGRYLRYRENPRPGDHIRGPTAEGILSRSMSVSGQALALHSATALEETLH